MKGLNLRSSLSARVFRLVLLAALAAGAAAAPFRLAAQEAAPAGAAAASEAKAKPEAAKSEEDVFRLEGPLVKATAKALNLSPEFTARGFEIVNFLVVVLVLGIPLARILPKVFRKRSETVRANLESARKITEEANTRLSAIEAKLAGLDQEIAQIRVQVDEESRKDEARIKSTIEEESARIVAAAEQEIAVAAAQARRGLRHYAADLAIEQAAQKLILTQESDHALIAEFLSDVNGAAKGGLN